MKELWKAAAQLAATADKLEFNSPVAFVYNPLSYAGEAHRQYINKYGQGSKQILFLGMNPGPWGMAQTGVPFGEVTAVRDWMGIAAQIYQPPRSHPRRPIQGFACSKSEVSGRRLWGLMKDRFPAAEIFFHDHFVVNYCPLVFMEDSGRNLTPDKLPAAEQEKLFSLCDRHLDAVIAALSPRWLVGIGNFAYQKLTNAAARLANSASVVGILHPSPANPQANRGWAVKVTQKLIETGIWNAL